MDQPPDPLRHFDEQQASFELMNEFGPLLAAQAEPWILGNPEHSPVGVIADSQCKNFESPDVLAQPSSSIGRPVHVLLVPREAFAAYLEQDHQKLASWLEEEGGPPASLNHRRLPIFILTPRGGRGALVSF